MATITSPFGEELSTADFDKPDNLGTPNYRRLLKLYPDCDDFDHPGCAACYIDGTDYDDED